MAASIYSILFHANRSGVSPVCVRSLSEDEELLEDDEESAMFQLFGLQV